MTSFRGFTFNISIWLCTVLFITVPNQVKSHSSTRHNHGMHGTHGTSPCTTTEATNSNNNQSVPQEQKVNVNGVNINYLRVGSGEHVVLLLPGAMGTIWMNYRPQIEGLSKEKFTIIAWDPPGYGKSRPPDRTFPLNFFHRDAAWARDLMKTIGYERFSLVGWSDGGITAMIMAAKYPENIRKLIIVAANSYISPREMEEYESVRNIDTWPNEPRQPLVDYYGEEYFRKTWASWVDGFKNIYEKRDGNLCKELLPDIRCPTLIVQGSNDEGVPPEHPVYLRDHIAGAKMRIIDNGVHPVQLQFPELFNSIVTNFLTE
ncbi:valacyclovir hydrolase-like [Colletes gigas]|uniref:valacyclovir hydrolase-like n=1 Tax=Colletes gigas TaxID=935657 RepID=UPI001C9B2E0F|nr:valacyclovir hydrolase-like [Colletes gigas]